MSFNFLQSLELDKNIFKRDSLIVTHQDGPVDGSFVLHFLLSEFSRIGGTAATSGGGGEAKVLLILNHQSATHWMSIASKLGSNIDRMKGEIRRSENTFVNSHWI